MDWREGDPDRRVNQDYVLHREYVEDGKRRAKWEADRERLEEVIVKEIELQKKFRWQSLALLGFISAAVPVGLTILGYLIP